MSHVLHVLSGALLSSASRPFATVIQFARARWSDLLSRFIRPQPSSLRVSQRWLNEHEATRGVDD